MTSACTSHTLNIGILAHVDAGKTSLTERLLFDTGAIGRLGSVDAGDTRTDTGAIERQRGITIRSAVASFTVGDTQVNLIDTPGHSDFIAEVERALGVLDGAVLLLSAVEGVQAQTRVLMRTLRRLRLPTLVFVNKIDRAGARHLGLLAEIRDRLTPLVVPMTAVRDAGTPRVSTEPHPAEDPYADGQLADVLAEVDHGILARLVDGPPPTPGELRTALAARTADGTVHPVYFGSALGGEGIAALIDGMIRFLPPSAPAPHSSPIGTVFAVHRSPGGERHAHLRLYGGALRPRERLTFHRDRPDAAAEDLTGRVTSLDIAGRAPGDGRPQSAGDILILRGLPQLRVGDRLGPARHTPGSRALFARPTLRTLVRAKAPERSAALRTALLDLAGQDPLIHARPEPDGTTSLLLYGEVQKEIVSATLAQDYGIEAEFEPSSVVCVERPSGTGEALHEIARRHHSGPWATVGLRVEPGAPGSGRVFAYETELGALPHGFHQAVEDTVHETLRTGPHGWAVTDCRVVLTRSGFVGPLSTAGDFRTATRDVLRRALHRAGTRVHEPYHAFETEIPLDAIAPVTAQLASLGARIGATSGGRTSWLLTGEIAARHVQEAERRLPGLTHGEGTWFSHPSGDRPANGHRQA